MLNGGYDDDHVTLLQLAIGRRSLRDALDLDLGLRRLGHDAGRADLVVLGTCRPTCGERNRHQERGDLEAPEGG